ncbi:MAG: hypothetical protein HYY18_15540 [Planctomycetes bacterium]|nr:hypothetical protein [Planctomycetota bacterium]
MSLTVEAICVSLNEGGEYSPYHLVYALGATDRPITVRGWIVFIAHRGLAGHLLKLADDHSYRDVAVSPGPALQLWPSWAFRLVATAGRDPESVVLNVINTGLDCIDVLRDRMMCPERRRLHDLADHLTFHRDFTTFFRNRDRAEYLDALGWMHGVIFSGSVFWAGRQPRVFTGWLKSLPERVHRLTEMSAGRRRASKKVDQVSGVEAERKVVE